MKPAGPKLGPATESVGSLESVEPAESAEPAEFAETQRSLAVLEIDAELAGARLDRAIAAGLGVSRRHARDLLARGAVQLNDRLASLGNKGDAVSSGDRLVVEELRPWALADVVPEPDLPLAVLANGPGWLAVNKPAGTPVHPLRDGERGTVLNAVAARYPAVQGVGEAGLRSGVVHRLDVDTSGVLLVATTPSSWERLRGAFREHRVEKVYRAIVWGELVDECRVEVGLVVAQHRPARVRVVAEGAALGGPAVWRVEQLVRPLEELRGATLVEVRPRTGFLHQVRATLAHLGHPVVGDAVYLHELDERSELEHSDRREAAKSTRSTRSTRSTKPTAETRDTPLAARHMLHAASVAINDDIFAAAPDPRDFAELLERLRGETLPQASC